MFHEWIGEAAVYEQLAEECTELSQAALKMARILRDENPTPMTEEEAKKKITEEYTDVILAANDLGLVVDAEIYGQKKQRWKDRLAKHVTDSYKRALKEAQSV